MGLNESLLVTVSMLLSLDVLVSHILVGLTLLLPVEFEVDIACDSGDGEVLLRQFHNFLEHCFVLNSIELWVQLEVICNDLVGNLCERLNLVTGEGSCLTLLGLHDSLGDVAILELELLLLSLSSLSGSCL